MKFAEIIPVKCLFPAWSMMPRCPTMTSYGTAWAAMVDAVKALVRGLVLNAAVGAATVDVAEVLESKTSLHLDFLLGPCAHVLGATVFSTNKLVGTREQSVDIGMLS